MRKLWLGLALGISTLAQADLSSPGLFDQQLNPLSTNASTYTRNPLDIETMFSGSLIDPRSIRALTSSDVVSSVQSGTWTVKAQLQDNAGTAITLSQKTMSASVPTVLASDQTGINTFLDKSGSGTIAALNAAVTVTTNGMSTIAFSAQGTFVATLQVQGQAGDGSWVTVLGYLPGVGTVTTVLTGASMLVFPIGGFNQVRLIAIAYTSGTANIQYNLGSGTQGQQVYNLTSASLRAMVTGSGTAGTPDSGVVSIQGVSGGTAVPNNVTQFGGTNVSTGTGVSGAGIPRVTVASDSSITANAGTNLNTSALALSANQTNGTQQTKITDGTNLATVKAASTQAVLTDTALVITGRPDNVGTPTQTSVSCAATSTTLLAANTATQFLSIRNPTTAAVTIWINVTGVAAVVGVPSMDLAPGSEADFFAEGAGFLPTSQIDCISSGAASSVTLVYK